MHIEHSIDIKVAPGVVYHWLSNLELNYKAWHPDHGKCYWIKGQGVEVGAVLYSEQYLHGKLHKQKIRMTRVEANRCIEFQFIGPHSLLIPNGMFMLSPIESGTRFTEKINLRIPSLFKMFFSKRLQALERHQEEEMNNLKELLENN